MTVFHILIQTSPSCKERKDEGEITICGKQSKANPTLVLLICTTRGVGIRVGWMPFRETELLIHIVVMSHINTGKDY